MNCDQIEELLSDFIDDELSEGAAAGVLAHLESCENCAAAHKRLLRTVRFVRKNGRVPIRTGTGGEVYWNFNRALVDASLREDPVDVLRDRPAEND